MTPQDLLAFGEMFTDLTKIFRFYGTEDQKSASLNSYFDTLQAYSLERVRAGYEQVKVTATKMPVPAQWIAAMPKGSELPLMTRSQAAEYDDAERKFFEGELCRCRACVEDDATHLPLRFVPCLDAHGDVITLQHPWRQKPVCLGRWIHGAELKRWWAARGAFYTALAALGPKRMPAKVVPFAKVQTQEATS
jgi:hypothetical protein